MDEHEPELHALWEPARPSIGRSSAGVSAFHDLAAAFFHPLSLLVLAAAVYGYVQVSRQGEARVPDERPIASWRSLSARDADLRDAPAALKEDSLSEFRKANTVEYGGPKKVARGAEFEAAVADALKSIKQGKK